MFRLVGSIKALHLDILLAEASRILSKEDEVTLEIGIHVSQRGYRSVAFVSKDQSLLERLRVESNQASRLTYEE